MTLASNVVTWCWRKNENARPYHVTEYWTNCQLTLKSGVRVEY